MIVVKDGLFMLGHGDGAGSGGSGGRMEVR